MDEHELLGKVNKIFGKNYMNKTYIETIENLVEVVDQLQEENGIMAEKHAEKDIAFVQLKKELLEAKETIGLYQLQETLQIEKNKKLHLEIRELKASTKFKVFEENLALAQEVARLKGETYVQSQNGAELSRL